MKCLICNNEYNSRVAFCNHISRKHNIKGKEYYDTYIKGTKTCKICGKETKFINIEDGYRIGCCLEHTNLAKFGVKSNLNLQEVKEKAQKNSHTPSAIEKQKQTNLSKYGTIAPIQNEEIKNKIKQTCIKKYGVSNISQVKEIKEKGLQTKLEKYGDANYNNREKAKKTNIERYGVSNPQSLEEVKEKVKTTNNKKYGVDYYLQSEEFKEKSKNTCKEKYGVEYYTQSTKFKKKSKETVLNNYGVDNISMSMDIIKKRIKSEQDKIAKFEKENNCTNLSKLINLYGQGFLAIKNKLTIIKNGRYSYISNVDIEKIEEYVNTHNRSYQENDLYEYIKSIYKGEIIKNCRSVINPYELDIYIPNLNLAFEYNGNYWHSTNVGMDKYYHINKTDLCLLKNIRLIHIQEWEWKNKQEICKSIISSALGIYNEKIYARNCIIREVGSKEANEFLEVNHIQGSINSTYRLGLYYNNELVQLITIGKSRFKKDEYELLRMCTKLHTQIIGGFSKLMKHQPYKNIISYIDRSKFNGNSYLQIGFSIIDITNPSYSYYKGNKKLNRISAQKHKLSKLLEDNYDNTKTEIQNMIDNGWLQVYDCGTIKVKFIK